MAKNDFAGKKVTVIGAAESGLWAVRLLVKAGAKVRCSSKDKLSAGVKKEFLRTGVPFEEGAHTDKFLKDADAVVTSPGVRPSSFPLSFARIRRIPVLSEVEAASRFIRGKWVAVTGTNGKTTTSTLIAQMIRNQEACDLCGNIGTALSRSILAKGPRITRVVEVSSFQLHYADRFKPTTAVLLNLRPNHQDWHESLDEYYRAKMNIIRSLDRRDTAVLNADDPALMKYASRCAAKRVLFSRSSIRNGIYSDGEWVYEVRNGKRSRIADLGRTALVGPHNRENIMAAVGACLSIGIRRRAIQKAIDTFKPLHHRIEPLGQVRRVAFVNDSKSTTLASTRAAINSFGGKIILVAGGRAKEKDFSPLKNLLSRKVAFLVLYGESRDFIARQLRNFSHQTSVKRFDEAVRRAFKQARPGQTLLLSPMCASFDQFKSYEERGEAFKKIFKSLKAKNGQNA